MFFDVFLEKNIDLFKNACYNNDKDVFCLRLIRQFYIKTS